MAVLYTPHFVQFLDSNANPLSGGLLYTYAAGTTTPKDTYTTAAGTIANPNPVVLDSAGRAVIFLNGSYKFVLRDSLGNMIRETDNVTAFSTQSSTVDNIVANFTEDVIATGDSVIFSDLSDGGTTKRDTVQGIIDLIPASTLQYSTRLTQSAGQALTTGALRTLAFDTETYDDGNWHDNVTNNSRITVDFTGRISLVGSVGGLPTSGNDRLELHKNGVVISRAGMCSVGGASPNVYSANIIDDVACVPGDYFELKITVNSNWTTDTSYTKFIARRIK